MPARRRVLAIGVDAAEVRLVRRLVDSGDMPATAALIAAGRIGRITSPAAIGSGAVWPTFMTGTSPECHGLFGEFRWNADTMSLERPRFKHLAPFWRESAASGAMVGIVDVPFAPVTEHPNVVDIADWGAHDWLGGQRVVRPAAVEAALADVLDPPHPLAAGQVDSTGPGDVRGLRHVVQACTDGARRRGDLTVRLLDVVPMDLLIVAFSEVHRASHLLWHTIDPDHPAWREPIGTLPDDIRSGLVTIFRAVDEAIGRIVARGRFETTVLFALHGMQPARGVPSFLGEVLEHWGYARRRRWTSRSARDHARAIASALKRRIPTGLKSAYYSRVPKSVTMQLAQPSMPLQAWDWSRTRAIALPTDQHGWIRLNVAGRESQGLLAPGAYASTCRELAEKIGRLESADGPLVSDVLQTAAMTGLMPRALPDLIVHWAPASWRPRLHLRDPQIASTSVGPRLVSQHADAGFFVVAGDGASDWPASVDTTELGGRLGRLLHEA